MSVMMKTALNKLLGVKKDRRDCLAMALSFGREMIAVPRSRNVMWAIHVMRAFPVATLEITMKQVKLILIIHFI